MKILYITLLLLVVGCSSHQIKTETNYEKVDSIIKSSEVNLVRSDSVNRESEKIITQKINQTVAKINDLKEEVKTAKLAVKTVTRIDTVYIETKKNFWGKTKTSTVVKSDSTEVVDSLQKK